MQHGQPIIKMDIYATIETSTITAGLYQAAAVPTTLFLVRQPNVLTEVVNSKDAKKNLRLRGTTTGPVDM